MVVHCRDDSLVRSNGSVLIGLSVVNEQQDIPDMDREIALMSSDIRSDLATAFSNNLFSFCKGVLHYNDLTEHTHGALCAFADENEARYKHVEMPRDHLKTTIMTIGRNMQKVVKNPNIRILLINETSTNAQRFLSAIRQHVEANTTFRALYSHVIPKNTRASGIQWNNESLTFNRQWIGPEPTIDSMGMTGAVTSRHFNHISIDDPISEEAVKSELVMADAINRIKKVLTLMVNPSEDTFDLTGTRWAFADLYRQFMKMYAGKMALFIRGAIEDGQPIWPERFSLETLAQMREDMQEYAFSCLMMNNPRNVDVQDFNVQDLRFWRYSTDEEAVVLYDQNGEMIREVPIEDMDITTTIDPAAAEKITSDRNAVVTVGTTREGDAIVLDTWAKRCSPLVLIEHLFWLQARFHPRVFGVEGVAYQKVLKVFVQQEAARRDVYLNINSDIKPGGRNKQHIKGLQPVAATGHLYVLPTMHTLRTELADWPLGEHDDVADALALNMQTWRPSMNLQKWARYKESEKKVLARIRQTNERLGKGGPVSLVSEQNQRVSRRLLKSGQYDPHPDDTEEPGWQGHRIPGMI